MNNKYLSIIIFFAPLENLSMNFGENITNPTSCQKVEKGLCHISSMSVVMIRIFFAVTTFDIEKE